jgi:hypothetical protein
MDSPSPNVRCPGCQSTRLNPGKLSQSDWHSIYFKPQQNWITAYTLDVVACLDCGLVSLFLDGPDLQALRENQPAE